MQWALLNDTPLRPFAVVLASGDDTVDCLNRFACAQHLHASQVSAIGAFCRMVLGHFNGGKKDYQWLDIDEQVALLALPGDLALADGALKLHAHVVIAKSDRSAEREHLLETIVSPTVEAILIAMPAYLQRQLGVETGLPLIRIQQR